MKTIQKSQKTSQMIISNVQICESVTDDKLKQVLLDVLSDEPSRKILDTIIDTPKSILEISNDTQVPIRTVYRKIQSLHDSKLLKISGTITDSGKKYFLYKSKIHSITVSYEQSDLSVNMIKI